MKPFLVLLALVGPVVAKPAELGVEGRNVLLICIDDLRPELMCFGASYIKSPNIDRFAASGRAFYRHYVQAPTCGASRYALLTGCYKSQRPGNYDLFERAEQMAKGREFPPTLPQYFRENGYTTVSVGKVSHHPGGRGGRKWDDESKPEMPGSWDRHLQPVGPWKTPVGVMHGLANGQVRGNAGKMAVYEAADGPDEVYPDGLITDEALRQIDELSKAEKPFFLAVGLIRPHLPFGAPAKYLELYKEVELPPIPHPSKPEGKTTWHGSSEFMKYLRWGKNPNQDPEFATEVRKHYAACVSYADAQVGRILAKLEETGEMEKTIIVLWGDHGWHLGEHAIWGKHALFEESLHSPLVIVFPGMPNSGRGTKAIVETLDLYPTLCDLAKLPKPFGIDGVSLVPQLTDPTAAGHAAASYHSSAQTLRTDTHRLVVHRDGAVELYDHRQPDAETRNLAKDQPEVVGRLKEELEGKLGK